MADGFGSRLMAGEHVLWEGAPARGVRFVPLDLFLVPFSLLWLGFVIFGLAGALRAGAPLAALVMASVFLLVGLAMVFGRFALDAWVRARTRYAVTNLRVLIARTSPFRRFTAMGLDRLADVTLSGEGRPRGSIRFGPPTSPFFGSGMWVWTPALDPTPQFQDIENAGSVFNLMMEAARRLRDGG